MAKVEKLKNLVQEDFDNCFIKINKINTKLGDLTKRLKDLKVRKKRLEPGEEDLILDAFIHFDFDCINPKFVKKNIQLNEMIYYIQVENDNYYTRNNNIMKIFKDMDKHLSSFLDFFDDTNVDFDISIIIKKENYKQFMDLMDTFEKYLDSNTILEDVEKLLDNNPLSIIEESEIIKKHSNGGRDKILILGIDKDRFKISIHAESYSFQSYIKIEKYSFEKSEWNFYHKLDCESYPIMKSIPHNDNCDSKVFDRIINACIKYILAFESYNIKEDKN